MLCSRAELSVAVGMRCHLRLRQLWLSETLRPVDPPDQHHESKEGDLQRNPDRTGERIAYHVADVSALKGGRTCHVDRVADDPAEEERCRQRRELHSGEAGRFEQLC